MSLIVDLEQATVNALIAAQLPELEGFAIESLGGQVDLENDELNLAVPTLLVAVVGANHSVPGADVLDLACVAIVPGACQQTRRQQALNALMAIRLWMDAANTLFSPKTTRTERLHPVVVAALFATYIG